MKNSKLGIEKFRITKLNDMSSIRGEGTTDSPPTIADTDILKSSRECIKDFFTLLTTGC